VGAAVVDPGCWALLSEEVPRHTTTPAAISTSTATTIAHGSSFERPHAGAVNQVG
jgi:hypothetical protein